MARNIFRWLLMSSLLALVTGDEAPLPRGLTWSSKTYGPDGPWQAVAVSIGTPAQQIDLYPGGTWSSLILGSSNCDNSTISPVCYGKESGLFNADESYSVNRDIQYVPYNSGDEFGRVNGNSGAVPLYAKAMQLADSIDIGDGTVIPGVSIVLLNQSYQVYPDGSVYPVEVGTLSLGAQNMNQSFTLFGDEPAINTTFIPSWLYTSGGPKRIPSYSYGMHIGSAPLKIPGSVVLGGYDQARTIGDVSSQRYSGSDLILQLLDIGIGVATGGSPWTYANKTGLLAQGNSSIVSGTPVTITPTDPYIYLPKSSCDAITAELPVTYQEKLGLYTWNTNDPNYERIVKSPAYLAFTFQKDQVNTANMTIKVPFSLLNLTLEAPLVQTPTPYFPCMPTNGRYQLGRAFLQAAFVGVNWATGSGFFFLAQAPGPGFQTIPSVTPIDPEATSIETSKNSWEDTWARHWTPLSGSGNQSQLVSGNSPSGDGGLSTGAKAGIGVACAGAGLTILSVATFLIYRRRRIHQPVSTAPDQLQNGYPLPLKPPMGPYSDNHPAGGYYEPRMIGGPPRELYAHDGSNIHELPSDAHR